MSSLVIDLQKDILESKKGVTELLRIAKLISAKLGLTDVSELIDSELGGYKDRTKIPEYREIAGGDLYVFNPVHGWTFAGHLSSKETSFRTHQPVSELEALVKAPYISIPTSHKFPLSEPFMMQFPQEVRHSTMGMKRILEAIKEQLFNWAIELEQRGIVGEGMSFDAGEKKKAQHQTFNIQHFTGVLGDVSDSSVNVYDYSSIHQMLKQQHVPQQERNKFEDILDELITAEPAKKATLAKRGEDWVVKHQELLGARVSIARKALGL